MYTIRRGVVYLPKHAPPPPSREKEDDEPFAPRAEKKESDAKRMESVPFRFQPDVPASE
jgi:hypothetical protein